MTYDCSHRWELLDYRAETTHPRFEQIKAAYTHEQCTDCPTRRLTAEGQPTYLIWGEGIEAA